MQDALEIPQEWINLNLLSGHAVGTSLVLQNISSPGDLFSLFIGLRKPDDAFCGVALDQVKNIATVDEPGFSVWVRYYRLDGAIPYPAKVGRLQVQEKGKGITIGNTVDKSSIIDYTPVLSVIINTLKDNAIELKLLNARIEEAFQTNIKQGDL